MGFPAEDLAGLYRWFSTASQTRFPNAPGKGFSSHAGYQYAASSAFYAGGAPSGGSGVVVCYPAVLEKTIVGLATMADIQRATLILTPNTVAVRQWISEILDKTDIPREMVGEYTGEAQRHLPHYGKHLSNSYLPSHYQA